MNCCFLIAIALGMPARKEHALKEGFGPMPATPAGMRARPAKFGATWATLVRERGIVGE